MLQTPENRPMADGHIKGSFDDMDGWGSMADLPKIRQFRLFLGEQQAGPFVWLFNEGPKDLVDGEPAKPHFVAPHLHRSPSFRLSLGDQPHQVMFDNAWHGFGEYILLDANKVYSEQTGVEGLKTLLILADRRGFSPANKFTAAMGSDEVIALNSDRFGDFGDGIRYVHTSNDQATAGAAITIPGRLQHGGRAKGSVDDQSGWAALSDGSRIAAAMMGDPVGGSLVILSRNAPHAIESPACQYGTDMFRLIIRGSCSIGGQSYEAGSFGAWEAGVSQGETMHGADGSTQLLFLCDKRHWAPRGPSGELINTRRFDEMAEALAPLIAAPAEVA